MSLRVLIAGALLCGVIAGGWAYRAEPTPAPQARVVGQREVEIVLPPPDLAATQVVAQVAASTQARVLPAPTGDPVSLQAQPEEQGVVGAPVAQRQTDAQASETETTLPEAAAEEEAPVMLSDAVMAYLNQYDWSARAGEKLAVWVSVEHQRFMVLEGRTVRFDVLCASAEKGVGSESGSNKTPLGWHVVAEKFGEGAPWGQVFRSRVATKEVWKPGGNTVEDLVLTRVLWLDGTEPGKNKGKDAAGRSVDSKERCIYIHGTNAEERIGTPSSHGCIRLRNDDVIEVFGLLPVGTPVLITP